jgi:hypothetical protein
VPQVRQATVLRSSLELVLSVIQVPLPLHPPAARAATESA